MAEMNRLGAVRVDVIIAEINNWGAVNVDVKILDVIKEELFIKGTYKLDCIILLTAVKLIVDILFAYRVEIRHVDTLPSTTIEVSAFIVIRFAAVVASGNACVFITAHIFDVFGDTVINEYGCVKRIVDTGFCIPVGSDKSMCKKRMPCMVLIVTMLLDASFSPLNDILPAISRIVTREPTVFTFDKRTIVFIFSLLSICISVVLVFTMYLTFDTGITTRASSFLQELMRVNRSHGIHSGLS